MKLRGYLTLGFLGAALLAADLIQRTVIVAGVKLVPGARDRILGVWQKGMAYMVLGSVRVIGGAHVGSLPSIPARSDILILMNHQSLLDIPLVVASLEDLYPRIVTRSRYARGKPLISHMIRLYQYPLVDPKATMPGHLEGLREAARQGATPMVIYPEGTRTRDGEIGRFKRRGLEAILAARQWEVYVVVADGFWKAAKLEDFVAGVGSIEGKVRCLGPFTSPEPDLPKEPFIEEVRERMVRELADMRDPGTA